MTKIATLAAMVATVLALSVPAGAQVLEDGTVYDPANNTDGAIVVWPLYDETATEHCSVWFPSREDAQPYADQTGGVVVGATYSLMEKLPECGA